MIVESSKRRTALVLMSKIGCWIIADNDKTGGTGKNRCVIPIFRRGYFVKHSRLTSRASRFPWQEILAFHRRSFSSTIPKRKERLFVVYYSKENAGKY